MKEMRPAIEPIATITSKTDAKSMARRTMLTVAPKANATPWMTKEVKTMPVFNAKQEPSALKANVRSHVIKERGFMNATANA